MIDYHSLETVGIAWRDDNNEIDLGGHSPGDKTAGGSFSNDQLRVFQVIALTCSSISLIMTLITFYWFLTMRRRFRHL